MLGFFYGVHVWLLINNQLTICAFISGNEQLRTNCMTLINAIITSPDDVDFRMHLRNEFLREGLLDVLDVSIFFWWLIKRSQNQSFGNALSRNRFLRSLKIPRFYPLQRCLWQKRGTFESYKIYFKNTFWIRKEIFSFRVLAKLIHYVHAFPKIKF